MNTNIRYSQEELKEFQNRIEHKLARANLDLSRLESSLAGSNSTIASEGVSDLEDSYIVEEQENLNDQAIRLKKFIQCLKDALVRINNGTYGLCQITGKLIDKQRLLLVPHTTHSVEAKEMRDKQEQ